MRRILVTGANKGIGKAVVIKLLQDAADSFVLLGARDTCRGEAAVASIIEQTPAFKGRVEMLQIDVTSDDSVKSAVESVGKRFGPDPKPLWGLVNNAGGFTLTSTPQEILELNYFGTVKVTEAFLPLLDQTSGRIGNVSSASGSVFVSQRSPEDKQFFKKLFKNPDKTVMDDYVTTFEHSYKGDPLEDRLVTYGLAKASVNVYTLLLAARLPAMKINACTPGFILTDLAQQFLDAAASAGTPKTAQEMGMKAVEDGAVSPVFIMLADIPGNGRYYGSDCLRSPLDAYRGVGDPEYKSDNE